MAKTSRVAPLALVALALLAGGCGAGAASQTDAPEASAFRGRELRPPKPTTDFRLRDQDGALVTLREQRGKVAVLAFIYTSCPDVCPLIAQSLNLALRQLTPAERARVRVLAISVDPEGDTPAAVRRFVYAHRLRPEFRYLTGTRAELARVWRAYGIGVTGSAETLAHTAYSLLVDADGAWRALYDSDVRPADVVHDVRALLG